MNIPNIRIGCRSGKWVVGRWIALIAVLMVITSAQLIFAETAPRIVGGVEVDPPFQYTWMAAIIFSSAPSGDVFLYQFCGGTLIAPDLVVTAAHCLYYNGAQGLFADDVDVLLGAHDLTDGAENQGLRQRIDVSQVQIHEDYDNQNIDNDIALLRLASPVKGLSEVALISNSSLKAPGTTVRVMGWGSTSASGSAFPEKLQEVDVPLVSHSTCSDAYGTTLITDNMLCAGYVQGRKDSCYGDSGGPLVVRNASQNNRWELTGIVSWGAGCARPGFYGVYADVYRYLDWIERYRYSFTPGLPGMLKLLLLEEQ